MKGNLELLYVKTKYFNYSNLIVNDVCVGCVSGGGREGLGPGGIMDDITLERVQQDRSFNIKDILNNESNSLYSNSNHSCKYYDFDSLHVMSPQAPVG